MCERKIGSAMVSLLLLPLLLHLLVLDLQHHRFPAFYGGRMKLHNSRRRFRSLCGLLVILLPALFTSLFAQFWLCIAFGSFGFKCSKVEALTFTQECITTPNFE
ncbi:unnamed protein product [Lactuca virosa]|uniref:Dolichyl-P-Glc:Glc(2)Man(9)GlcNAc(2)-PP-dolichol alpha-1,2-glucosyltransferase n=1 Tax=Lactuca virosa TaxID=75947 RepID=A0AAU9NGL2_9ASTR|nr:unnamed protein product [Lactuca virosa]